MPLAERARVNTHTHSYATPQAQSTLVHASLAQCAVRPINSRFVTRSPNGPALRANPYPEVTDLFCRLPLPTLFYWPEAFHLGDLLRIWVRICTKFTHLSPNSFKGQCKRIGWHKTCATFSGRSPYLRANRFQGTHFTINEPLNKKRQLSPKLALT